jgi:hypothetical protein
VNANLKLIVSSLTLALTASSFVHVQSADKKVSAKDAGSPLHMVPTSAGAKSGLNMSALHRLDFIIKGTSRPACLLKIQKRLEQSAGVAQAGIMLAPPYGGVCIYDSSKTEKDKILTIARGSEAKVTFDRVEDEPVNKIPVVLIPHHATDAIVH